jgi:hypothetical protein
MKFENFAKWRRFVLARSLSQVVPQIVTLKFERAQKLYLIAWIDFDLIKAGELVALTALELALKDCYGNKVEARARSLNGLLRYMVEKVGLTDEQIPMCAKSGGTAARSLYETEDSRKDRKATGVAAPMTLAEIRNALAHGYPFDGFPWGGLLELVRDLITYAYGHSTQAGTIPIRV